MQLDLAELGVRRFKNWRSHLHGFLSFAGLHASAVVEVAKVVEVAFRGERSVLSENRKIADPDVTVNENNEKWNLKAIMTVKKAEFSDIRG